MAQTGMVGAPRGHCLPGVCFGCRIRELIEISTSLTSLSPLWLIRVAVVLLAGMWNHSSAFLTQPKELEIPL